MTFWTVIVLIFVTTNTLFAVLGYLKKKGHPVSFWLIVRLLIAPGIFPYALFIYGFIHHYPAFYTLIAWNPTLLFFAMFTLVVAVMMVSNLIATGILNEHVVVVSTEEGKRAVANSRHRLLDAVQIAHSISAKAGFYEELIFRFTLFFACLSLLKLWEVTFGLGLINTVTAVPLWLSLGAGALLPATAFTALFLLNVLFAIAHLQDEKGKFHFWPHKVIYTWFFGWVVIIALVQFGFVGAILVHYLMDFILMTPLVKQDLDEVKEEYWNTRYGRR